MLEKRFGGCKTRSRYLSGRVSLSLLLSILALAMVVGGRVARADDLNVGGSYPMMYVNEGGSNTNVYSGGGSITVSSLDGVTLQYLYCVAISIDISVPGDYNDTTVYKNGVVNGAAVNNDAEIAWLVDNYGVAAEGNTTLESALQLAIWHEEYGYGAGSANTLAVESAYATDTTGVGTAALSSVDWFSPGQSGGNGYYVNGTPVQGLVGNSAPVPEPTSILLLGGVLLMVGRGLRRKLA